MSDLLISTSAVEKRRIARKNITIGIFVGFIGFMMLFVGKWVTFFGIILCLYAIYKFIFRGVISLWIYKE
ncbi:MAG: hypothetical protein KGV46_02825 [Pasteurella sp.]|nr:hypothetical protein [Pasteurella sp.]